MTPGLTSMSESIIRRYRPFACRRARFRENVVPLLHFKYMGLIFNGWRSLKAFIIRRVPSCEPLSIKKISYEKRLPFKSSISDCKQPFIYFSEFQVKMTKDKSKVGLIGLLEFLGFFGLLGNDNSNFNFECLVLNDKRRWIQCLKR